MRVKEILKNMNKPKKLFIIHNFFNLKNIEDVVCSIKKYILTQFKVIVRGIHHFQECDNDKDSNLLIEHVVLAFEESEAGKRFNHLTY